MKKVVLASILVLTSTIGIFSQQKFVAYLNGQQEVPPVSTIGSGTCIVTLNAAETSISVSCTYSGLTSNLQADHIHGNGVVGVNAGILFNFAATGGTSGSFNAGPFAVTPAQVANMRAHRWYINLHSVNFSSGEIRGQIKQANTVFDLDGDGRTDVTVFRQTDNRFYTLLSQSNALQATPFGTGSGDIWLNNTADFDGDGRGDPLLIKIDANSIATWCILRTGNGTVQCTSWGNFSAGVLDTLAINDYDGDARQDIAVFRRSNGLWCILQSSDGAARFEFWGTQNDFPSIGDYDGDGRADLCAVRVESGQRIWYIRNSSNGQFSRIPWGLSATDGVFFFAPLDIDGDGRQDICVNRTVSGQRQFIARRSSDGQAVFTTWGASPGTTALFGDYDGDGKTDFVARQSSGGSLVWHILRSSDGGYQPLLWGLTGDQ